MLARKNGSQLTRDVKVLLADGGKAPLIAIHLFLRLVIQAPIGGHAREEVVFNVGQNALLHVQGKGFAVARKLAAALSHGNKVE